ncbi:MAG: polyprenyl synthetase family protein [Acidobacteria bacterium]|nr:polyprenyl synthetase family protein [Acidobacteriota bacterium]
MAKIDAELNRLVPAESVRPSTIHRAMRHSLFAGGKRIRPVLLMAAAEAIVGDAPGAVTPACSLELIHTYSLIHDDLPALDNDDFRRGVPTCHTVFGEAMAILAGDALLTRAFQVLAEADEIPAARRIELVRELAVASGTVEAMIGGQVEDLEAERQPVNADRLHYIHRSKTGALLRASVVMGGIYAGADEAAAAGLGEYGRRIGLAFQIVDDILDVTADTVTLGKTAGKDVAQGKATFPALFGLKESRRQADEHYQAALAAIEPLGEQALRLREIAERVVTRTA